jgi:hypothetical protein
MPGPGCDWLKRRHEGGLEVVIVFDWVFSYHPSGHRVLSGDNILALRIVRPRADLHQKAARGNRFQPGQGGSLGESDMLRHGCRRPRNSIAEQS